MDLGSVVRHEDGARGIVVYWKGRGSRGVTIWPDDDYAIQLGPGSYRCGNAVDEWEEIPETEWTAEERVRSAGLRWIVPEWAATDEVQDSDTYAFAVVRALLPPAVQDRVFDYAGDWPHSIDELAVEVAHWIDDHWAHRLTLGVALGRLR